MKLAYEFKDLYLVEGDLWPFWLQEDGSLCDAPNVYDSDLAWNSLEEITETMDGEQLIKGTISDHVMFAQIRVNGWTYKKPVDRLADIELIEWYNGLIVK